MDCRRHRAGTLTRGPDARPSTPRLIPSCLHRSGEPETFREQVGKEQRSDQRADVNSATWLRRGVQVALKPCGETSRVDSHPPSLSSSGSDHTTPPWHSMEFFLLHRYLPLSSSLARGIFEGTSDEIPAAASPLRDVYERGKKTEKCVRPRFHRLSQWLFCGF